VRNVENVMLIVFYTFGRTTERSNERHALQKLEKSGDSRSRLGGISDGELEKWTSNEVEEPQETSSIHFLCFTLVEVRVPRAASAREIQQERNEPRFPRFFAMFHHREDYTSFVRTSRDGKFT
jgi:hypothetical protein